MRSPAALTLARVLRFDVGGWVRGCARRRAAGQAIGRRGALATLVRRRSARSGLCRHLDGTTLSIHADRDKYAKNQLAGWEDAIGLQIITFNLAHAKRVRDAAIAVFPQSVDPAHDLADLDQEL